MLPDFKMIVHKFPARPDIEIWPISDVHLGAAEHNAEAWADFCQTLAKRENAYAVLGGDLINNATKSSVSNCYDEVLRPREQKRLMVEMLTPLRDKIIAVCSGNHERRNRDVDNDITYDICCKLDIETLYRENAAFIKLQFGDNKDGSGLRNPTYNIALLHGAGGGVLTGGVVNKVERFANIDGVDIVFVGHSHKPFVTAPSKICINPQQNMVYTKTYYVVSMTGWMNYGGYACQKMYSPASISPQIARFYGRKKKIEVTM